jgi:uncharacterized protein YjaG (DUF416 family)
MISEEKTPVSIAGLSPKNQLAFALLVFERMLPSLIAFSKDTGFDDSCYLHAKDAAWAALENAPVDQSLNGACRRGAPDTEEYRHELTSFALDAALAMSDIMEFAQDGCADHIKSVSTRAGESVYLYLNGLEDSVVTTPEQVSQFASHPLMQEEHRREEEDIRFLASLPEQLNDEAILSLRARADTQAPLLPLTC